MMQANASAVAAPLITRYLAHVRFEKRLAERTVKLYTLDLLKLSANAVQAGVSLTQVQPAHVRRWVAQMHSGGRSGRGIALILSGWRGFYTWLGHAGLVTCNPVVDVHAPKAAKPLPKALNVDEAVQLASFHAAAIDPWLDARDAAVVELLYGGGLRLAEITGLDLQASASARGWLDLAAGETHVLGKGSKRRVVPIGAQAVQAVQRWLQVREQKAGATKCGAADAATGAAMAFGKGVATGAKKAVQDGFHSGVDVGAAAQSQVALFIGRNGTRLSAQSIWKRLRARSLQAGLPTAVHPHMLRHSFASHVLQSSGDLRGVQELLGHANIRTTQIYTRLDFAHLAKTYDSAHPRAHLLPGGSK